MTTFKKQKESVPRTNFTVYSSYSSASISLKNQSVRSTQIIYSFFLRHRVKSLLCNNAKISAKHWTNKCLNLVSIADS